MEEVTFPVMVLPFPHLKEGGWGSGGSVLVDLLSAPAWEMAAGFVVGGPGLRGLPQST